MKKILSVLLSIILILGTVFSGAVVNAATPVTFTLSAATVNVGETATVTVTSGGSSFSVAALDFVFDASALRLTEVTSSVGFECMFIQNDTGARVLLTSTSNKSGSVATLSFETLKSGTYSVTAVAEEGNVSDTSATSLVCTFNSANVTINCNHQYVFSHVQEPTCKEQGEYVYICNICGEKDPNGQKIATIAHISGEERITKEPDCVNTGLKQTYCAVCDEPIGTAVVVPANGHVFGDWMIDEAPTCSQDGVKVHICEVCGDEVAENIPKSEHNSSVDNATWLVITPANCTNAGLEALVCNDCGEIKDEREIPAVDSHDYIWAVTKEATCKEAGEYSEVCRICGDVKQTTATPKLPHTEGKTVTVKATCASAGSETVYCAVCDELLSTRVLEQLDHVYSPLNVTVPPTNTLAGSATHTCVACGHTENVTLDITNAYLGAENLLIGKIEATKAIKLAVSIQNSKLFYAGMFEVYYDSDIFEFVGCEANGIDVTINASELGKVIVLITADSIIPDGKLLDLLFEAKTKTGESEITIENVKFSDGENDVFFNVQNGSIGLTSVLDGDVNKDGTVDVLDLGLLKKGVIGIETIINKDEADLNYDGKINVTDLAVLKKVVAGIITLN